MKILLRSFLMVAIALPLFAFVSGNAVPKPSARVWLVQGNQRTLIDNQEITLKKKPFRFELEIIGSDAIYLHASTLDTVWQRAKLGLMPYQQPFAPNCMAEDNFNKSRLLLVDDWSLSYWFYDPQLDWHRFDKGAKLDAGVVKARKTIKKLWLKKRTPESESTVKMVDFSGDLYLVFMVGEQANGGFFDETILHQVTFAHVHFE